MINGISLAFFLFFLQVPHEKKNFARLYALEGVWAREKAGTILYEQWQKLAEDQLQGKTYQLKGTDTVFLEKMSLNRKNRQIVFSALTSDDKEQGVTAFFLTKIEKNQFYFENPTHDFPKRIIYELVSQDSVHAWIDGGENIPGNRIDYHYRRISSN